MPEITSREEFEAWLRGKPREVCVALAVRSAMRVVPLYRVDYQIDEHGNTASKRVQASFRALAIAWSSVGGYNRQAAAAAAAAATAAFAAAFSANPAFAFVAAFAAAAAADADAAAFADAAAAAADAARAAMWQNLARDASAADAARAAMWQNLARDAGRIDNNMPADELLRAGLFPYEIDQSREMETAWQDFRAELLRSDPTWSFWTDWYDERLKGGAQSPAFEKALLTLTKDEWKDDAEKVNARLAALKREFEAEPEIESDQHQTVQHQNESPFIFISYSSKDRDRVAPIVSYLRKQDIAIWWDQDILAGQTWHIEIQSHLNHAAAIVTFWTNDSVNSNSVIEEARRAQSAHKLVPVKLEECNLPYGFSETQYADLTRWNADQTGMKRLLAAIKRFIDPPSPLEKISHLVHASDVEYPIRQGRMDVADKPAARPPEKLDPQTLEKHLTAQRSSVEQFRTDLNESNINYNTGWLEKELDRYFEVLVADEQHWFALDDQIEIIRGFRNDDDLIGSLPKHFVDRFDIILKRHEDMEPYIRPSQENVEQEPVPYHSITGLKPAELNQEIANIRKAVDDGQNVITDNLARHLEHQASDLEAALENDVQLDDDRKEERLRKRVARSTIYLGGLVSALSASVLTSSEAGAVLLARLNDILAFFLKFF